jgi:hypothetical protein
MITFLEGSSSEREFVIIIESLPGRGAYQAFLLLFLLIENRLNPN